MAERGRTFGSWGKALRLLHDPATPEKRRLLAERWDALDPAMRLPGQGYGQKATGCGATIGLEPRCDFSCTGCYLGTEANKIPALSTEAVKEQLDRLRRHLGPKSNIQLTDGEATLRPLPELIEIIRHARAIGGIPMLMTHGDNLRRRPGLLEQLMEEGGLSEVSIHIDITQRGRDGHRAPKSELELMPLREEFAERVRSARKTTGLPLRAATTLTVSRDNLGDIAAVVRWTIQNRDAFSLISFQPLAQVGRTRKGLEGVTPTELWTEVGRATADFGLDLADEDAAEPLHFGHPACTRFVPLIAIQNEDQERPRLLPLIRTREEDIDVMKGFFARGLGGTAFREDPPLEALARGLGLFGRAPFWFLGPVRRWVSARLRDEADTSLSRLALGALRKKTRVDGLTLTSHHFMAPHELTTELGKARLAACVFHVPDGDQMIPMCEMNAGGVRDRIYADIVRQTAAVS